MPNYRITLLQNMRADQMPSALQVRYTYNNGNPTTTWPVTMLSPNGQAVVIVTSAVNLLTPQHVQTRTLIGHYATAPVTIEYQISSVQPPLAESLVQPFETSAYPSQQIEENPMSTPYSINFTMDQNTVTTLSANKFVLFGFKAVKSLGSGAPVVWFSTPVYGLNNDLQWEEQYQAYTSNDQIVPGGTITATNSYPIGLNESLMVTSPTGAGTVNTAAGTELAISLVNQTSTQLVCGISQTQPNSSTPAPMCAFPLFGQMTDVIAPIEKVLLMFAAGPVNTGTVIEEVNSQGILVDLTGENAVSGISFNMNNGWNTGGQENCSLIPSNQNLVPLLIQSSASLAKRVLSRRSRAVSA